jgi:hypothetical protein
MSLPNLFTCLAFFIGILNPQQVNSIGDLSFLIKTNARKIDKKKF